MKFSTPPSFLRSNPNLKDDFRIRLTWNIRPEYCLPIYFGAITLRLVMSVVLMVHVQMPSRYLVKNLS